MPIFRKATSVVNNSRKDSRKGRNDRQVGKYSKSSGGFASKNSGALVAYSSGFTSKESKGESKDKYSGDSEPSESPKFFGERPFKRREPEKKFLAKRTSNKKDIFLVVCSKCGEHCEVPFKPSNNKPIFCSKCFVKSDRPPKSLKPEIKEIKEKLDRVLELLAVDEE